MQLYSAALLKRQFGEPKRTAPVQMCAISSGGSILLQNTWRAQLQDSHPAKRSSSSVAIVTARLWTAGLHMARKSSKSAHVFANGLAKTTGAASTPFPNVASCETNGTGEATCADKVFSS